MQCIFGWMVYKSVYFDNGMHCILVLWTAEEIRFMKFVHISKRVLKPGLLRAVKGRSTKKEQPS